jgi:hypothetical protein
VYESQEALVFDPGGDDDVLPIVAAAGGVKKSSGNFFTNYAKKVGRFYTNAVTSRPARGSIVRDDSAFYSAVKAQDYNDFANYLLEFDDDQFEVSETYGRGSGRGGGSSSVGVVKQIPHEDAPVKGLFDVSMTGEKFYPKTIYAGVMRKVDITVPDTPLLKQSRFYDRFGTRRSVVAAANSAGPAGDLRQESAYSQQAGSASASGQYAGVTSRQGPFESSSGGSVSGFSSSSFPDFSDFGAGSPREFESAIRRAEGSFRSSGGNFGGGSSGGSSAVSAAGSTPLQPGVTNPGNPSLPGTGLPDIPQPGQPEKPGENPQDPAAPSDIVLFDEKDWTLETVTSCSILGESELTGSKAPQILHSQFSTELSSQSLTKDESGQKQPNNEPKRLTTCDYIEFDDVTKEMKDYQYYVSLGAADEKGTEYVTITDYSIPAMVLNMMHLNNVYTREASENDKGEVPTTDDNVVPTTTKISKEEHQKLLNDPKTFTLTVNSAEVKNYPYTSQQIDWTSLETEEGARKTWKLINNQPDRQKEIIKNDKNAKKEEIIGGVKGFPQE